MNKKIELLDGNILLIDITEGYCCNTVSISKGYLKEGTLIKTLNLSIWDDISFHAHTEENNDNQLEFEFEINDPIYFCLNRLLGDTNEFIIDDDDTRQAMVKYMQIIKEESSIKIVFTNTNQKQKDDFYKYGVFIKNIGPDCRSKIQDDAIKLKIVKFFRDIERTLLEEYHQISFDEYLERLRIEEIKEQTKTIKKIK